MKRMLSIILCLVLVMAMLPTTALADDTLGGITITGGQSGTDYTLNGGCLTIESSAALTISGSEADFRIVVAGGKTANLTLSDAAVDMSASTFAAIDLASGAKLNLTVSGVNTLKGGTKCAGISVPEGTTLSISGSGTLNVFGGTFGAGIGGGTVAIANDEYAFYGANAGTININSGTVTATGGNWAAGIGGGAGFERESGDIAGGSGGTINISGGTVNASAGRGGIHPVMGEFGEGAGIGGGGARGEKLGGAGGSITISGGIVNADSLKTDDYSVGGGAAIGGGYRGEAGNITISAGTVVAEAGLGGAGIGSGSMCEGGGAIKISAGSVTATGGKCAAGIGTGWTDGMGSTPPTEIIISGGKISATGGNGLVHPTRGTMGSGAGIGGGYRNVGSDVTISGGIVSATGGGLSGAYDDNSTVPSAIGAGSNNSGTHRFTTGQSGSAVINAKTSATPFAGYITDQSNKANWLGTIFEGTDGTVYGSQTINDDFTIDAGQTLTIPAAASFTIAAGVTITNNGSIVNNGLSRNNGTITGVGTVTCNNHNWDAATYSAPKTCAFCKITEGEHLPRVRYGIMEGAGEIYQDDKIYFGKYTESNTDYDIPWVVLNESSDSAFLLSEYLLGNSVFDTNYNKFYKDSTLNVKMDELYNEGTNTLFSSNERGVIAAKTNLSCVDGDYDDTNSPAVSTAYLYPLSYNEAAAQSWGSSILQATQRNAPAGMTNSWWLRSSLVTVETAFCVNTGGEDRGSIVNSNYGVRPACNLDLSKVLFTSSAVGGKAGNGALKAVDTGVTDELKLTLLDNGTGSGREDFAITTPSLSAASATVDYTGAKTGTNEYLSAIIVDSGNIIYYGRIKSLPNAADASGTVTISIPSGVTLDEDTQLKVFNEQFNGDRSATDVTAMAYTDYASELLLVTAPAIYSISATPKTLSFGSVQAGYTRPEAQTVTITNTGNQSVTVTLPTLANYSITAGSGFSGTTAVLSANGNTAAFTVQPNASLGTGTYTGTIAIAGSNNVSDSLEAAFEVISAQTAATPVFSPDGGTYTGTQSVTLSCSTVGATIRYTTDGSVPTESSAVYTGAITVSATTTIKAKAFKNGMTASSVASASYVITASPNPVKYDITQGASGKWTKGDSNGLSFTADADYSKFTSVSVDGSTISSDKYNSEPGSTIITLKASYLQTLSVGQHMLRINFTDGYAEAYFTIKAAGDPDIPTTGDNSRSWMWLGIALIAGAGLVGSLLMLYKWQRQNNHR